MVERFEHYQKHGAITSEVFDVVRATDYDALAEVSQAQGRTAIKILAERDALAAELATAKNVQRIDGLALTALVDRVAALEAALEPFRHTRVRQDESNDYVFTDLLDGTVCVIAYVRNGELADDFNERFERIRTALDGKP